MSQFYGTHQNRLDAKGRVSVPAAFRATLKSDSGQPALILRPSEKLSCMDAWPEPVFKTLQGPVDALPEMSQAHDDLAATIFAEAARLEVDKDGRISLPPELIAHARLTDAVVFMGLGRKFQIWEPAAAAAFREAVRERQLRREETAQVAA
jgi:MraZ protein